MQSVEPVYVEDTQYLGPGRGGDRAYKLLSEAMERTQRIAVGRYGARGREQLVLLRPYKGGLVMHRVHYADEVRPMEEVDLPERVDLREMEIELAKRLIGQLSVDRFEPERYPDEYRDRVLAAVQEKVEGREVTAPPEVPQAQIFDLYEALKRSLAERAAAPASGPGLRKAEPRPAPAAAPTGGRPRPLRKAGLRRKPAPPETGTG